MKKPPIPLPTRIAQKYVKYLLGFGAGIAAALAVFLGRYRIPLFEPLLALFPEESRGILLPLSGLLVGMVAVAVQFHAVGSIARKKLKNSFNMVFILLLVGVLALLVLRTKCVVSFNVGQEPEAFIIGWSRMPICPCAINTSALECLAGIAFQAERCWSENSLFLVKLSLYFSYLFLIGGFGGLVGILILVEENRRTSTRKPAQRGKKQMPAAPGAPKKQRKTSTAQAAPGDPAPGDPEQPSGNTDSPEAGTKPPEPERPP